MSARIRIGIFGTGIMADIYARLLAQRTDCTVVAAVGNSAEHSARFAATHGIPVYADGAYDRMFAEHPGIDAVVIATPEWVREAPIASAMRHQVHILLEKPFAATLADAQRLEAQLRGYPKVVELCHVLRHSPRFHAMYETVASGAIGEVRHMHARRHSNSRGVTRVLGKTDLAFWLTPHDVDIMRWITGAEVTEVFARSRNGLTSADDYLIANLRFSTGVDAVLEISWCTPPLSGAAKVSTFGVWGTAGAIELDDTEMNVRVFTADEKVREPDTYEDHAVHGIRHGMFENLIAFFVSRVQGRAAESDALEDGLESIRVCDMISRSIASGGLIARG